MPEKIDYLHHARELQVADIKQHTEESSHRELLELPESVKAFVALRHTPPITLPMLMEDTAGSEEAFFDLIYPAALAIAKGGFVLDILEKLLAACSCVSGGYKEVLVDQKTYRVPPPFKLAFRSNPDFLRNVLDKSCFQGTVTLLEAVQGRIPLMKYRRDMVETRINLSRSIDGGAIGYLETKIPSVNLKLWYPKEERLPQVGFTIDDITQ